MRVKSELLIEDKNLKLILISSKTEKEKEEKKYLQIQLENELDILIKVEESRGNFAKAREWSEQKSYQRIDRIAWLRYGLGKEALSFANERLIKSIYLNRLVAHLEARKQRVRGKPWIDIKDKEVHHINGNPLDNRTENLIPVSKEIHLRIHRNYKIENLPSREQILKMIEQEKEELNRIELEALKSLKTIEDLKQEEIKALKAREFFRLKQLNENMRIPIFKLAECTRVSVVFHCFLKRAAWNPETSQLSKQLRVLDKTGAD